MSFFDTILLNSICVLFPIIVYVLFLEDKNDIKRNDYLFDLVLISTLFLMIKYTGNSGNNYSIILINTPLLFSYIRNKRKLSVFLSMVLILYLYFYMNYNIVLLVFEYITYFILHLINNKRSKNSEYSIRVFIIVKAFYYSLYIYHSNSYLSFIYLFNIIMISLLTFYLCSKIYYKILIKGEEIINLNNVLKELEKEKVLRNSLFKLTHEIKNPIAVCKGYLEMIDINDKKSLNKKINIIKNEIERTLVIMDDFLDYTKIKVNKDIMDINYLLEDTIDSVKSLVEKNNVKLVLNIIDDEIYINGDYNRLKQVFVNIIKNSIESCYNRNDSIIKIDSYLQKSSIIIKISDNGIGMTKEELENIGKMYYSTKNNGTGLGISLSKEIIDLHEGALKYTSKEDFGTTAEIFLPIMKFNNC